MRNEQHKNIVQKSFKVCLWAIAVCIFLMLTFVLWRVFVADRFIIPSNSMYPTLKQGDRVLVNKLIFGARIYGDLKSTKNGKLDCWRAYGKRNIKHNDIVIFNFPLKDGKIFFKMNYVYVKRCVALPGDSISIKNYIYKNNNFNGYLGDIYSQLALRGYSKDDDFDNNVLQPNIKDTIWTIRNFGPLYVPKKDDIRVFTQDNILPYKPIIEYETGQTADSLLAEFNGKLIYKFKSNYYFMAGDNVANSLDSRYWGFVPEDFIVGVVSKILFNKHPVTNKKRYDRRLL